MRVQESKIESPEDSPAEEERARVRPWIRWIVVALGIFLLVAIAVPNFVQVRVTEAPNACINNLRQIDGAKQLWALDNGIDAGVVPTLPDIAPYLSRDPSRMASLRCPASGGDGDFSASYTIGAIGESPKCNILPNQHFLAR